MAATISNAIKALIEAAGLGVSGVRDETSPGRAYPFVKIQEGLDTGPDPISNAFDEDSDFEVTELVQVELLMQKQSPHTHAQTESYTLPDALHKVLHGARLPSAPSKVYGMRVIGRVRIPDAPTKATNQPRNQAPQPSGVVRIVYTVQVKRNLI